MTRSRPLPAAVAAALLLGAAPASATPAEDCIRPADRTAAQISECLHGVGEASERRLNETYQRALAALDPASAQLLREAQRHWVAFREAEVRAQNGPWRREAGTARRIDAAAAIIGALDERERELRLYLPD